MPDEVIVAGSLLDPVPGQGSGTVLDALRSGARVLHLPEHRPGAWRLPDHLWWSLVPRPGPGLREDGEALGLVEDTLTTRLSRGRSLEPPRSPVQIVLELLDLHGTGRRPRRVPLVVAATVGRGRLLVSALRGAGEAAGAWLHARLAERVLLGGPAPPVLEIEEPASSFFLDGPWEGSGDSLVAAPGGYRTGGTNTFQGWADFRCAFTLPRSWRGPAILRAEAVGDGWELFLDGRKVLEHGNLAGTWDGGRDKPFTADLTDDLPPGRSVAWRFRIKDWRGAGGLVGPVYLKAGDPEAGVLY